MLFMMKFSFIFFSRTHRTRLTFFMCCCFVLTISFNQMFTKKIFFAFLPKKKDFLCFSSAVDKFRSHKKNVQTSWSGLMQLTIHHFGCILTKLMFTTAFWKMVISRNYEIGVDFLFILFSLNVPLKHTNIHLPVENVEINACSWFSDEKLIKCVIIWWKHKITNNV